MNIVSAKRNLDLIPLYGVIGDDSTPVNIWDATQPNHVWIRQRYANGVLGAPVSVLGPAGTSVQLKPGTAVRLAWTQDRKLAIVGYDNIASAIGGQTILQVNTPQPNSGNHLGQQSMVTALVVPQTVPDMTVRVWGWCPIVNGTQYLFPGGELDLSGDQPTAGNECYSVVFLGSDYATLESHASTPQEETVFPPLTGVVASAIQECLDAAGNAATPLAVIRLYGEQTSIVQADIVLDERQLINVAPVSFYNYTPSATADTAGKDGDWAYDDSYVYHKVAGTGWKRSSFSTF